MARYTFSLTVAAPLHHLCQQITEVIRSCNLATLYLKEDYLLAREVPGQVHFNCLVTVEMLADPTQSTPDATRLCFVVKNEELPIRANNHCYQMFQRLNQLICEHPSWQRMENDDHLEVVK